jgi:hypothetical protein
VQAAGQDDVLVVYFSGHGVTYGGTEGDFHYLTAEAQSADLTDPDLRASTTLACQSWKRADGTEIEGLADLIYRCPAGKKVLILDTCASGKAVESLSAQREVSPSQILALERMKDRTGFFMLSGCAADAVSYEASRYAQGVLTYSLLLGMKGAALDPAGLVDVDKLFSDAVERVETLARGIGGIQKPRKAVPGGRSFHIGQLDDADRGRIVLQAPRPLLRRARVEEEALPRDKLGLGAAINARLWSMDARSRGASFVFVEADEMEESWQIGGRYRIGEDGAVVLRVHLFRGTEPAGEPWEVTGATANVEGLVEQVVEQTIERLTASAGESP